MTTKTENASPDSAASKLANMIPSPGTMAPVKEEPELERKPEADPPQDLESPRAYSSGEASPLKSLELEEAKPKGRTRRPNGAANTAASREVRKKLPSDVRVLVYRRRTDGSMGYIASYSANDLAGHGAIASFLEQYVVPTYGYGEYELLLQEKGKEPKPAGSEKIEPPLGHDPTSHSRKNETKEIMEMMLEREEKYRREQANRKSPAEELKETMALMQSLQGSEEKKSGMDPSMLMMMLLMKDKPAPQPPGPDPLMLKLLDRLDRMEESQMHHLPPPPPPPPPVDNSGQEMLALILEQQRSSTAMMIEAMKGQRDPITDLANLTKLTGANDDRLTTKDILGLLPQLKEMIAPNQSKSSIAEALDTLRNMRLLEREFSPQAEEVASSSFWDFMKTFVQSDMGEEVGRAIKAQMARDKVTRDQEARALGSNEVADEVANRNSKTEPESEPTEPEGIEVPDSFRTRFAPQINEAAEPNERIRALLEGLQHLGMHADFRPYAAKVFGLARENRKMECLDFLSRFLGALCDAEALVEEACNHALEDLETFWDITRATLKMPDIPEVYPEGHDPDAEEDTEDDEDKGATVTPIDQRSRRRRSPAEVEFADEEEQDVDRPAQPRRDPARDMKAPEPEPAEDPADIEETEPA